MCGGDTPPTRGREPAEEKGARKGEEQEHQRQEEDYLEQAVNIIKRVQQGLKHQIGGDSEVWYNRLDEALHLIRSGADKAPPTYTAEIQELHKKIDGIAKAIKQKAPIATATTPTWANIAAAGGPALGHPRGVQTQADQAIVRLRGRDDRKPTTGTEKEILAEIKASIPTARAVNILRSGDVQVSVPSPQIRDQLLCGPDPAGWTLLRNGYAVEIPAVRLDSIPGAGEGPEGKKKVQEALKKIQEENKWKGRELLEAKWLHEITPKKKADGIRESTPYRRLHGTLIITATTPGIRDRIVRSGVIIGGRMHIASLFDFGAIIRQCFSCQEWGHTQRGCNKNPKCGRCAGEHQTKQCKAEKERCVNCGKKHTAWRRAECIAFKTYLQRVQSIRSGARAESARMRVGQYNSPTETTTEQGWETQTSRKRRRLEATSNTPAQDREKRPVGRPKKDRIEAMDPRQSQLTGFTDGTNPGRTREGAAQQSQL
jgi:hypothetical protein